MITRDPAASVNLTTIEKRLKAIEQERSSGEQITGLAQLLQACNDHNDDPEPVVVTAEDIAQAKGLGGLMAAVYAQQLHGKDS